METDSVFSTVSCVVKIFIGLPRPRISVEINLFFSKVNLWSDIVLVNLISDIFLSVNSIVNSPLLKNLIKFSLSKTLITKILEVFNWIIYLVPNCSINFP